MATLGAVFDFVEGDTLTTIKSQLVDEDTGIVLDLTGGSAAVRFVFRRPGDGAWSIPVDRALTVTDAANGKVEYQFLTGELLPGLMRLEASASLATGKTITTKRFTEFTIRPRL
jgi:hypothetical protein